MTGIRVDTEWLRRYAEHVRDAGEEVVAARADVASTPEPVDAFGDVGRLLGASDAYERVSRVLLDETGRLGEVLVRAGEQLSEVVDFHTGRDDDGARELSRERTWL